MEAVTVVLKPFQRRMVTLLTTCFLDLLNSKKQGKKGARVSKSTKTEYTPSANKFEQQNLINCCVICYSIQKNIMLSASPASLRLLYVGKLPMCISGQVCYVVILQHIHALQVPRVGGLIRLGVSSTVGITVTVVVMVTALGGVISA